MKYSQFYSEMCKILPKECSCPWDNDGNMLCLDGEGHIKRILIALDITLPAIEYAKEKGYDLILSHHPLIFKPMKGITSEGITGKRVCKLIKYGISAMSFHTRLDTKAVNEALCEKLELRNVREFDLEGIPMGRIGELGKEMTCAEFAEYVKEHLCAPSVEFPNIDKVIKNVAVLGGSGGDAISDAVMAGADCLLTGECGYNKSLDSAEDDFPVFAAGHFFTENPVCEHIGKIINEIDKELEWEIYSSNIFSVK